MDFGIFPYMSASLEHLIALSFSSCRFFSQIKNSSIKHGKKKNGNFFSCVRFTFSLAKLLLCTQVLLTLGIINICSAHFIKYAAAEATNVNFAHSSNSEYVIDIEGKSTEWELPESCIPQNITNITASLIGGNSLPEWIEFQERTRSFKIQSRKNNSEGVTIQLTGDSPHAGKYNETISIRTRNIVKYLSGDNTFTVTAADNLRIFALKNGNLLCISYETIRKGSYNIWIL
jgi:hypothetical protein